VEEGVYVADEHAADPVHVFWASVSFQKLAWCEFENSKKSTQAIAPMIAKPSNVPMTLTSRPSDSGS
jgi:hypothetical protein